MKCIRCPDYGQVTSYGTELIRCENKECSEYISCYECDEHDTCIEAGNKDGCDCEVRVE